MPIPYFAGSTDSQPPLAHEEHSPSLVLKCNRVNSLGLGRLEFLRSFGRKTPHVHKIPLFLGGGDLGFGGGGGSADFIFMCAGIFLN